MSNVISRAKEATPSVVRTLDAPSRAPKRTSRRWLRRGLWGAAGVAAAAALGWSFVPKPVPVDTVRVARGDLVVTVEELARTRVRDRYVVAAPLAGNLVRIELRPGDQVTAGSVLARITPLESPLLDPRTRVEAASRAAAAAAGERQAKAAVGRAEAAASHATDDLARTRRLFEGGSIAEEAVTRATLEMRLRSEELASARFAAQMAAHEEAMARAALARVSSAGASEGFDVPAPATGKILRVLMESAGPVQPGTALVEIGEPAALEIVTEVLSADAVRIRPGAAVIVERWGGPDLRAEVRRVEPAGTTRLSALGVEEQRVPIVIDLDEPRERWSTLGDGFRVETRIVIEEKRGVHHVPLGSVFRHDGGWAVWVVEGDRARRVKVTLGARGEANVEIAEGIADGAVVVVHPSERVREGVRVTTP
ncbi:MAG: HlyD family efflux transporter periplasmic adaptor subunit [Labilithrix sp.]|nr:HlyD family efflux transporter periplasmic adaptor subunit [Labilithrix sp.]MCW5812544.1 HlyD family efflux transporter periplasmic adaptor subunit [Labilithrix sp.]